MPSSVKQLFATAKQDWLSACQSLEKEGQSYCIVTIIAEAGSLPRGTGSKMVVSEAKQFDTLGGGQLEFDVISKAREGLKEKQSKSNAPLVQIERFLLAADLGQCCGGAVQVMFEYINTSLPKVVVFGAGHVCHSLATILKALPCHLSVIDSRKEWLESLDSLGVSTTLYDSPAEAMAQISEDAYVIIMTHEHSLDFELTRLALERKCFPFIGLIASQSKKKRFEFRLKEKLTIPGLVNRLTCPIGDPSITGKLPMQVAVSITAQLMGLFDKQKTDCHTDKQQHKTQWDKVNQLRSTLHSKPSKITSVS